MSIAIPADSGKSLEAYVQKHCYGLVTLVFTDLVDCTKMKDELGDLKGVHLVQAHHQIVREILRTCEGAEEIKTAGDSFLIAFPKPSDAVRFSVLLQAELAAFSGTSEWPIRDRVGIHVGEVMIEGEMDDVYGLQVDACARIMSLAEGGQVLMSQIAFDTARQALKGRELAGLDGLTWLHHGRYFLKGVGETFEICEVGQKGRAPLRPPPDTEKAHRVLFKDELQTLGWRPGPEQKVPDRNWILMEKIGEGGFGEVWKARHEFLKKVDVFKFYFEPEKLRSLKREVTLFATIREKIGSHRNIVGIQDVCLDRPPFFLILDYVDGLDLEKWGLKNPQIGFGTRLEIIAQVADALHAAHKAGVVHRDIKPSNVLITLDASGKPLAKLTDFGVGQVSSEELLTAATRRTGPTATTATAVTGAAVAGTFLYSAPEVVAGEPASPQSDIYSLGLVCYQLLTGVFGRRLPADWPVRVNNPLLVYFLSRCFAEAPNERWKSAGELALKLRSLAPPDRRAGEALAKIRFWGVRGTVPSPGPSTAMYGGNTPCIEVRSDGEIIILDAGTGIRPLGLDLAKEFKGQPLNCTILLTHMHWDHIQGLPLFQPLFEKGNKIRILSFEGVRRTLKETLSVQMERPYSRVRLGQLPAELLIEDLKPGRFQIGNIQVDTVFTSQSEICAAFRLQAKGRSIAYVTDMELMHRMIDASGVPIDLLHDETEMARRLDDKLARFIRGADILIADCQFTVEEYSQHVGEGHSCFRDVVLLAIESRVKELFLFHHDPSHDDAMISEMVEQARDMAREMGSSLLIDAAREGVEVVMV